MSDPKDFEKDELADEKLQAASGGGETPPVDPDDGQIPPPPFEPPIQVRKARFEGEK